MEGLGPPLPLLAALGMEKFKEEICMDLVSIWRRILKN